MPKMANLASFGKPETWRQTVSLDCSALIWQKIVVKAKIEDFNWDFLSNIQNV